jgi:hypothetical protein
MLLDLPLSTSRQPLTSETSLVPGNNLSVAGACFGRHGRQFRNRSVENNPKTTWTNLPIPVLSEVLGNEAALGDENENVS